MAKKMPRRVRDVLSNDEKGKEASSRVFNRWKIRATEKPLKKAHKKKVGPTKRSG